MKLAIVGTGYVGLVTGTCLADTGNNVICVDIDKEKVEKLKNNVMPIYEPDLETIFERNVKEGRLEFTTDLKYATDNADIIFLALPTPPGEDGSADLSYILGVADNLGKIIKDYKIIINKSTVPVGTADLVRNAISKNAKTEFDVVSNPEFLREGLAVDDFMKPDRIVIGTKSQKARKTLEELFAPFVRQGNPIVFMDERSSELTKYVSALHKSAKSYGYDFDILESVMKVNEEQKTIIVPKIKTFFNNDLKGKKIALWGLAFKPDTDDIREAPSLYIIDKLLAEGANISVYDPEAMENVRKILGDKIEYCKNHYDALIDADALVIATEWSVFRTPDFDKAAKNMKAKVIFDGRNLYDLKHMEELGFYYSSIGRRLVNGLD